MQVTIRKDAMRAGMKTYFSGKPCPHGHLVPRLTKTGRCTACHNADNRKQYHKRAEDPEFRAKHNKRTRLWWASNRPKANAAAKRRRQENPESNRERCAAYYAKNRERCIEGTKRARAANPERYALWSKEWRKRNPEQVRALNRASRINRRTRERANGGAVRAKDVRALFERYGGACAVCRSVDHPHVDHIMPVALGGSSDPSNLQILCRSCNRAKSDLHPDEWLLRFRSAPIPRS